MCQHYSNETLMQLIYFAVTKTFSALKNAEYLGFFTWRGSGGGGYLEWFKIIPKC